MNRAIPSVLDDRAFRGILGIPAHATKEEIRRAYRLRAREDHPDFFPAERKQAQELRMIALNEAYAHLMRFPGEAGEPERKPAAREGARQHGSRAGKKSRAPPPRPAPPSTAVGFPKDPSYAYYKQGFLKYSAAVHGIAELSQRGTDGGNPGYFPRYQSAEHFAYSLRQLAAARGYFSRVTEEFPQSPWCPDARVKLRRIEGFVRIYRRILENLGAGEKVSPPGPPPA